MRWIVWRILSWIRRLQLYIIWKQLKNKKTKLIVRYSLMGYWDDMEEYWWHKKEALGAALFIENSGLKNKISKEQLMQMKMWWAINDMSYIILLKPNASIPKDTTKDTSI